MLADTKIQTKTVVIGDAINELPKSNLPASLSLEGGYYPFYCSSSEARTTETFLHDTTAIVMGTGGVASVHLGKGKFSYSTDTWAFRAKSGPLETEYLFRVLQVILPTIDYAGFEGSGLRHLRKDFVRKLEVALPTGSHVTCRIVEVLQTIDQAIERTEALIEKYSLVKAGMMHDLFTRGLTPDGKLRPPREEAPDLYKETPIGWLPKEWEPKRLDELSDIVRGSTPRPAKDPRYFDGRDVPWITVGELSKEDWPYLNDTRTMLTELGSKFSRHLKSGTLVISNSGYGCGVPKILNIDGCANDGVAAFLNFSKDCDQRFIYYFLYSQIETLRTKVARGNDQPNLNTDMLGAFCAPVPDHAEQVMIAERLWVAQSLIRKEKINRDKLRLQKTGLMHDLLAGEVTAKVDNVEAANV